MSRAEAERILARTIEKLASATFDELWSMREAEEHVYESVGSDGETYTTDIDLIRDRRSGNVEVILSVGDGSDMPPAVRGEGRSADLPTCPSLMLTPARRWCKPRGVGKSRTKPSGIRGSAHPAMARARGSSRCGRG